MTCVRSEGLAAGVRQRGTFIGKTAVMNTPLTMHVIALLCVLSASSAWVLRPEGWCRAPRQGPKVLTAHINCSLSWIPTYCWEKDTVRLISRDQHCFWFMNKDIILYFKNRLVMQFYLKYACKQKPPSVSFLAFKIGYFLLTKPNMHS